MSLHFPCWSSGHRRHPLVVLHGLFGRAANWRPLLAPPPASTTTVASLCVDREVHVLDSTHATHYTYPSLACVLHAQLDRIFGPASQRGDGKPPVIMGHSMGGKTAMYSLLAAPRSTYAAAIIVDVAPVSYVGNAWWTVPRVVDAVHRTLPLLAMDSATVSIADITHALMKDLGGDKRTAQFLASSIDRARRAWCVDVHAIRRDVLSIGDFPFPPLPLPSSSSPRSPSMQEDSLPPVLFIGGANSNHTSASYDPVIRKVFPNAEIVRIPSAGHWVHVDQPMLFTEAVRSFLSTHSL
ncbi:mitochondrial alpha/beta hydrolase domain-containing protein [Andalucia godoyi]|uniref:Mitochondrial alpha/beta hydrolase domain-containing protein n=1 Tax=Andalucia godoyi TaxID=505711 RepID=A0A8K0AJZ3_ANDGO|nr:mitochondrial alpha/beta hydrolase domain-containing protein [Andalucia godoyi]|eukprot:ANDGO_05444.mRNA.1 mitochondrial alpha/beta hydrolase domain-containing protein (abhydrolase domain-containing protein 11)